MEIEEQKVNFGFWNCAISPPNQHEPVDPKAILAAIEIIKTIFAEQKLSFLILCEINSESYEILRTLLGNIGLESILADDKSPTGSRLDIACVFLPEKVAICKMDSHFGYVGTSSVKISQEFSFLSKNCSTPITLFASHWPSRLQYVGDDFRNECSIGLRNRLALLQQNEQQFILMGDYNDDPYSQALFKNLKATNDRALVISKTSFWLYNPFWRSLFARSFFERDSKSHDFGTCYNLAKNRNSWATFDQIIFSGDFLKNGKWHIHEEGCFVVSNKEFVNLIMDNKNKFDHLPIIGSIINH